MSPQAFLVHETSFSQRPISIPAVYYAQGETIRQLVACSCELNPKLFSTTRFMNNVNEEFIIPVKTNDMADADFKIIPFTADEERRFEVFLDERKVGTLHKTFEFTWEWLDGDLTLSDAEEIGEKIEAYQLLHRRKQA